MVTVTNIKIYSSLKYKHNYQEKFVQYLYMLSAPLIECFQGYTIIQVLKSVRSPVLVHLGYLFKEVYLVLLS